jgi:hypothetical protein
MKRLTILMLGFTLVSAVAFAEGDASADQKWLAVVAKMVEQGKDSVSTGSETRVSLVKNWASEKGLTAEVKKTDQGFQITFSKSLAAH